jgi:SAM-dependent methyltransferase
MSGSKMENFENNWKNKTVFKKQLELNLKELQEPYPNHWVDFLSFLDEISKDVPIKYILDIGCGCGVFSELLQRYAPSIQYTGIDYSREAIEIAAAQWRQANFVEMDYKLLVPESVSMYDIVNVYSLTNVLQDGDAAIDFLLSLNPKNMILGKILLTTNSSYFDTYMAYDEIMTYRFFHNYENLVKKFQDHGYSFIEKIASTNCSNFLLRNYV